MDEKIAAKVAWAGGFVGMLDALLAAQKEIHQEAVQCENRLAWKSRAARYVPTYMKGRPGRIRGARKQRFLMYHSLQNEKYDSLEASMRIDRILDCEIREFHRRLL